MMVMNGRAPRAGAGRLAVAGLGVLLLAGCQSVDEMATAGVAEPGWRVVERLGEARYRIPGGGRWAPIVTGSRLPAGAEVGTGKSGRLIMVAASVQVSAGPSSAFLLPDPASDDRWRQDAGRVRYRASGDDEAGIEVVTPHLEVAAAASVFDVLVDGRSTEVMVASGQLRLATPDGRRHGALFDGQTAMASGLDEQRLAIRDFAGGPYESVEEEVILPAMRPRPAAAVPNGMPSRDGAQPPPVDAAGDMPAAGVAGDQAATIEGQGVPAPDADPDTSATPMAKSGAAAIDALRSVTSEAASAAPAAARAAAPQAVAPMGAPPPPLVGEVAAADQVVPRDRWAAAVTGAAPLVLAIQGMFERGQAAAATAAAPEVAIRPAGMATSSDAAPDATADATRVTLAGPATSPAEARQLYDRLAEGMLDDLPRTVTGP